MTILNPFKKPVNYFILVLLCSTFFSGCAYFNDLFDEETEKAQPHLPKQELLYKQAEELFQKKKYSEAQKIFLKITGDSDVITSEIYDKSLYRLVQIYEKNDALTDALLVLAELQKRKPIQYSSSALSLIQLKNHYKIANYTETENISKKIMQEFRSEQISAMELEKSLELSTTFNLDHRMLSELKFLGEVQKFYILIMAGHDLELAQAASDKLQTHYTAFQRALKKDYINRDVKRSVSAKLLDQFKNFDKNKKSLTVTDSAVLKSFSRYSRAQYSKTVDWLYHD